MSKKSTFALVDPRDGAVRHVESSGKPFAAYQKHLAGGDPATSEWVSELAAAELKPDLRIVSDAVEEWAEVEAKTKAESGSQLLEAEVTASASFLASPMEAETTPTDLVARNLRSLRTSSGYSQAQVASTLGKSQPTVARIERGLTKPSVDDLQNLSTLYGVSPGDLFSPDSEDINRARQLINQNPKRKES